MGLLTEYFAVVDDSAAAVVVSSGPTVAGVAAVDAHGVEPFVQLGSLEEILTGRPYDQISTGQPDPVVDLDGGQVLVVPLRYEVVDAISQLDDRRVHAVAVKWAAIEEFGGGTDPEALADLLRELRGLARSRGDHRLYCWVSV